MKYEVEFDPKAFKEYKSLDNTIRKQFDAVLNKMLEDPDNFPHKLLGNHNRIDLTGCYKIKLKASGYRLIYEILENKLQIYILSANKRDKNKAYIEAFKRRNN